MPPSPPAAQRPHHAPPSPPQPTRPTARSRPPASMRGSSPRARRGTCWPPSSWPAPHRPAALPPTRTPRTCAAAPMHKHAAPSTRRAPSAHTRAPAPPPSAWAASRPPAPPPRATRPLRAASARVPQAAARVQPLPCHTAAPPPPLWLIAPAPTRGPCPPPARHCATRERERAPRAARASARSAARGLPCRRSVGGRRV